MDSHLADRRLIISTSGFFSTHVNNRVSEPERRVEAELERLLDASGYFEGAPFDSVDLTLRIGFLDEDKPIIGRVSKRWGDIPLTIEIDAVARKRFTAEELDPVVKRAALKALVHAGRKHKRPIAVLEDELERLGEDPVLAARSSPEVNVDDDQVLVIEYAGPGWGRRLPAEKRQRLETDLSGVLGDGMGWCAGLRSEDEMSRAYCVVRDFPPARGRLDGYLRSYEDDFAEFTRIYKEEELPQGLRRRPPELASDESEDDETEEATLVVEYEIDGCGTENDLTKRHGLEDVLDELLTEAGLGFCEGGSIGSGTMEVFVIVTDAADAERAGRLIREALEGTEFADYSALYREEEE